jgi:hypothetical protein
MIGAKYLAEERGVFEAEASPVAIPAEAALEPARAPLYEVAAVHDGQPPIAWLSMFREMWV